MIFDSKNLPAKPEHFAYVRFVFGDSANYEHEISYPLAGETLTVIVEDTDRLQEIDLTYCRCRVVWFYVPTADWRRATVLWNELLKLEHQPAAIYIDSSKGLFMYLPAQKKGVHFNEHQ